MAQAPGEMRHPRTLPHSMHRTSSSVSNLTTTRSRTDPLSYDSQQQKTSLHRRIHSNNVRERARGLLTSQAQHAKDTVQSAIELKPPISFDHILRRDRKTGNSGSGSKKDGVSSSLQGSPKAAAAAAAGSGVDSFVKQGNSRFIGPAELAKVREAQVQQEKELAESLKKVEDIAMDSTRQLDEKYYNILDRVAILRATVSSLHSLAEESRQMHAGFTSASETLQKSTEHSLDQFENFNAQEKTIDGLVTKLKNAKAKKDRLGERLEAARQRIEKVELQSKERMQARKKQWQVIWLSVISLLVLIVAALTLRYPQPVSDTLTDTAHVLDQLGREMVSPVISVFAPNASPSEDPYLAQLFDDL